MKKVFVVRIALSVCLMFVLNVLRCVKYAEILFYITLADLCTVALMQLSKVFFLPVVCSKQKIDYKHIFKNSSKKC